DLQHSQSHNDVTRMQSNQRIEGGPKKIRLDRQADIMNQVIPLTRRRQQEDRTQQNRHRQKTLKHSPLRLTQRAHRKMNRDAARKQANRTQNRQLQHLRRRRSAQAFSDVVDISDDEDQKDRRLRQDE